MGSVKEAQRLLRTLLGRGLEYVDGLIEYDKRSLVLVVVYRQAAQVADRLLALTNLSFPGCLFLLVLGICKAKIQAARSRLCPAGT